MKNIVDQTITFYDSLQNFLPGDNGTSSERQNQTNVYITELKLFREKVNKEIGREEIEISDDNNSEIFEPETTDADLEVMKTNSIDGNATNEKSVQEPETEVDNEERNDEDINVFEKFATESVDSDVEFIETVSTDGDILKNGKFSQRTKTVVSNKKQTKK